MCQNVDCMISANVALTKFGNVLKEAVVAEWLRRLTRNQFPSGSVGSPPVTWKARVRFPVGENVFVRIAREVGKKRLAPRGIEPVTFALLARRSNQLS